VQVVIGALHAGGEACLAELERHVAFPFRLEGRHVDDDPAARISALAGSSVVAADVMRLVATKILCISKDTAGSRSHTYQCIWSKRIRCPSARSRTCRANRTALVEVLRDHRDSPFALVTA
jgi:hypothetical protein